MPPRAWAPTWQQQGLAPELVLCSPAVRARQTLDLVLPHLAGGPTVVYEDNFYLAAPSVLLARVRKIEAKVRHVLIVGHDPGMQGLALELSGSGEAEALQAAGRQVSDRRPRRDPLQGPRLVQGRTGQGPARAVRDAEDAGVTAVAANAPPALTSGAGLP